MTKFITILIGCCLALAVSVQAEQEKENPKNKKSKPVQKQPVQKQPVQKQPVQKQPVVQKKSTQRMMAPPKPHAPMAPTQSNNQIHNTSNSNMSNSNMSKQPLNTLPKVQSNNQPVVPSTKVQVNKTVKAYHPQHQNFHAQVNSSIVSAKFNHNFHIKNAQNWHGAHYTVFKNYQPQWHDKGWWHSHHHHVVLIGGGWYFWNAGYWAPAWGYDTSAAYYPYDGPIYVGNDPKPFDEIVADVQSVLQEQGYYHGEVDGLVGPLTQEALAAYQSNAGLEQTAAIDQPTLESLGIGS
jgi:hypothetical protein